MDLKLEIAPRTRGRAEVPLEAEVGRLLSQADIALLSTERGVTAQPLKKLRAKHHALARALAAGLPHGEAAAIAGYSPSRVSILLGDPTFTELVDFYRRHTEEAYRDMHDRMAALGADAVDELHDRLEEEPDKFSNTMLLELATKLADRTGYGPSTTSTSINIHAGIGEKMEAARKRKRRMLDDIEDAQVIPDAKEA